MLLTNEIKAQWFSVNQDTTFSNTDMFFLNADTGFVVGANYASSQFNYGVISRTLNGGISWDTVTFYQYFPTIYFPSTTVGYCGGQDGQVFKTTDMGNTWNHLSSSFCCNDFSNSYFFNNDTGFVVLWPGNLVKTFNGGLTWNLDTSIGGYSSYPGIGSIQFMNDSIGIIAAGENGTYARTFDKGNTWQTGHIDSSMVLISIYMRNLNSGYAVGYDGKFSRTFDGGQTWTSPVIISQYHLNDVTFFNDSVGYIVGGEGSFPFNTTYRGIIYKTIDAGNSWFVEDSSYDEWLTSVVAVNDSVGYAAGWKGRILKITNGNSAGIQENISTAISVSVFPNPTDGVINFKLSNHPYKTTTLNIYDLLGTLIKSQIITKTTSLDISMYSNGVYIYEINEQEKASVRGKILKEH